MAGVPYAFAHPAAVIPLHRLLGRYASASALVIGSIIPDAWYFLPFLGRDDSHSLGGLFFFCLPAGLFAYAAFHLIFKEPLLALVPRTLAGRLRSFTCPRLPAAPWGAVVASLAAGALTHLAWDGLTHPGLAMLEAVIASLGTYELRAHQVLQHGSTVLGSAFLAGWVTLKLRRATPIAAPAQLPAAVRNVIVALLAVTAAFAAYRVAAEVPWSGVHGARLVIRAAGVSALSTLGLAILAYCLLWRWRLRAGARSWSR